MTKSPKRKNGAGCAMVTNLGDLAVLLEGLRHRSF